LCELHIDVSNYTTAKNEYRLTASDGQFYLNCFVVVKCGKQGFLVISASEMVQNGLRMCR